MVAAIFISACVAGAEAISRLAHPRTPTDLVALADGKHARADAYVSAAVGACRSPTTRSASRSPV